MVMKKKPRKILQVHPSLVPCKVTGTVSKVIQILYILAYHDALKLFTVLTSILVSEPGLCFRLAAGKPFSTQNQKINPTETGRTTMAFLGG